MTTSGLARRTVQTNGIELSYVEEGQGEPLILIMGLGADAIAWELHIAEYRRRFRCFAVDNRGAGRSSAPAGPYSTAEMADDYAGLINRLSLPPVRVVGISMGGAIAQELALRHPRLVERIVIVSSWARCDAYTAEVFRHFATVRAAVAPAEFMQLLQLWIWSPPYVNEHPEELREAREAEPEARISDAAFNAQIAACVGHDTLARLGGMDVPTLVTAGSDDIFTPLSLARQLREHLRGAELRVFPGAGHAHHWEQLATFNQFTTQWLS